MALALSAVLHGALAATALLWPDTPPPLPTGPITVALISVAPTIGERSEPSAAGGADVASPGTASTAGPAPSAAPEADEPSAVTVPLAVQNGPDETEPADEPVVEKTTPVEEPAALPPPPIQPRAAESPIPPPLAPPARDPLAPAIPPPPRRPASLALAAVVPTRTVPKAAPIAPPPKPNAFPESSPSPAANPVPADETTRQAALGPSPADTATASGDDTASSPQNQTALSRALPGAPGARSGGAVIGPHFAMGSAANPRPRYPLSARRRGIEGRVVLRVFVGADGRVQSIAVLKSSHHTVLDDAAVRALSRWRFEPARQAGLPVAGRVDIPVAFRLRD